MLPLLVIDVKFLELFAGSRSIGRAVERQNQTVFSTDIEAYDGIDLVCDIRWLMYSQIPFIPNAIWGSTVCTGFSRMSTKANWGGGDKAYIPIGDSAFMSIELAQRTIEIIEHYLELNPKLIWWIENPVGLLRVMPFMIEFLKKNGGVRHEVWYCKYGDNRAKPTDIWTNSNIWSPRPKCRRYKYDKNTGEIIDKHCHHESARRGARTGTQGMDNAYNRSKIPDSLCDEIVTATIKEIIG